MVTSLGIKQAASSSVVHSRDEYVLAISGSGPSILGSLLLIDNIDAEPTVELVDRLASHVMVVGERFFRIVPCQPGDPIGSEFMAYDRAGIAMYRRVLGLSDPHAFAWSGEHLIVPNTHHNQLLWLTPDGATAKVWQAPTASADSWHINGVTIHRGRVVASAFGRFPDVESFAAGPVAGKGIVFEPETGRDLITGLSCPHDPRYLDGAWFVCDSRNGTILHVDPDTGERLHTLDLGRWTRGVAFDDERIYVGLSAQRYDPDDAYGALAIVDRATWQLERIVPLPCKEVNSIELVPRELMGAIRRGFRTNAYRVHVQDTDELHRLVGSIHPRGETTGMRPLEPEDCRVSVAVHMPEVVLPGQLLEVPVTVENHGARTLLSVPPHPVHVGFQVTDAEGVPIGDLEHRRAVLPDPIAPGQSLPIVVRLAVPDEPGRYTVSFTLVQEAIRWFDTVEPQNATRVPLVVSNGRVPTVRGSVPTGSSAAR